MKMTGSKPEEAQDEREGAATTKWKQNFQLQKCFFFPTSLTRDNLTCRNERGEWECETCCHSCYRYQPFFSHVFLKATQKGGSCGRSSSSGSLEPRSNISEVKAADIQRHTHLSLKLIKEQPAWSSARKAAGPLWIWGWIGNEMPLCNMSVFSPILFFLHHTPSFSYLSVFPFSIHIIRLLLPGESEQRASRAPSQNFFFFCKWGNWMKQTSPAVI